MQALGRRILVGKNVSLLAHAVLHHLHLQSVRIVGLVPLCLTRRSVVRILDLAELHRNGSVDADAALDAASRTPVLGVVVRQWGVGEPA